MLFHFCAEFGFNSYMCVLAEWASGAKSGRYWPDHNKDSYYHYYYIIIAGGETTNQTKHTLARLS